MKKILSIVVVFLMLFGYTPTLVSAVELFQKDTINILEKSTEKAVIIQSNKALRDLKLYVAAYKGDTMIGTVSKKIDLSVGENTVEMTPTWTMQERDIVKIFLWDKNMSPKADRIIAKTPVIAVSDVYADFETGTAKVEVSVLNNPGISSLKFDVAYDKGLELLDVELNEAFGAYVTTPKPYTNPQSVSVLSPLQEITENGCLATLTFDISKVDKSKAFATVSVKCDDENIFDESLEEVAFATVDGKIIFNDTSLAKYYGESVLMEVPQMKLVIGETAGMPGEDVQVEINLNNNPGIASLKFDVLYDDVLTLKKVTFNSAFGAYITAPEPYKNPQTVSMISPMQEINVNGNVETLTFTISEEAKDGYVAEIDAVYDEDNVFDGEYNNVELSVEKGKVSIYEGIPGDVNADGKVNNKDAVLLFRYIAGWTVDVDEDALDVTGDDKVTNKDAIELFRYVAGWSDITLYRGKACDHALTKTEKKSATCTEDGNIEYWQCSKCGKYYSDAKATKNISKNDTVEKAKGHTIVIDEYVAPTYETMGKTEGKHCSVCNTVIVKQENIPVLTGVCHNVSYDVGNGDDYIEKLEIQNPNPTTYYENKEVVLKNLTAPGYRFLGWYDGAGDNATQVKKIAYNSKEDVELYAHWEKIVYKVQLKSDIFIERDELTYTVDTGVPLPTPKLSNYIFTGWSDEDGKLYRNTQIPKGTTGNITLTANWTSERNKTWTKKTLDDPIILEDGENILFAYEIGEIQNVPMYTIKDFGYISGDGVTRTATETYSFKTDNTLMSAYSKTASNATTESSNWSLSSSWNDVTSVNEEWAKETGKEIGQTETIAKNSESNWNVSSGRSGSTETSSLTTNNKGWENEVQISKSNEKSETDSTVDRTTDTKAWNINGKLSYTPKSYSLGIGVEGTSANASVSGGFGFEVGGGYEHKWENEHENSHTETNTTKTGLALSGKQNASTSSTESTVENSSWNSSASYGGSSSVSQSTSNSINLSEKISQVYGYGHEYAQGEESSQQQGHSSTQSYEDGYSSSVTYSLVTEEEKTNTWTTQATKPGYHRWVVAGTAHVFGVVGYNMLTRSYYTYTYSVMDDKTYEFEDYSYTSPSYSDNENGVISFEIPYGVAEYVAERTSASAGLKVDLNTGIVTEYTGTDTCVVIPEYFNTDSGDIVKITGIATNAFRNNINLEAVVLSDFITEIPDYAFEGCTSLIGISGGNIKKIGKGAFSECVKIKEGGVTSAVECLGDNAFKNVGGIIVNASNADVVKAAANSGAKEIIICLEYLKNSDELNNTTITVPEGTKYFELNGKKDNVYNMTVDSNADVTVINKVQLESSNEVSIKTNSPKVILNQTSAKTDGLSAVFMAENTKIGLQGTISLISENGNAMLCKQVELYEANSKVVGKMSVEKNVLACSPIVNQELFKGNVVIIDNEDFDKYLNFRKITFDANGGSVGVESKLVPYNTKIGELPVPSRNYYSFEGWYTQKSGGEKVTADYVYNKSNDMTLYAHWKLIEYSVDWNIGTGYSINVNRTSSPYANATIGNITSGSKVYYGDVLKVTYAPATGYSLTKTGETTITVNGNVTSSNIYAAATLNSYTYNVVYKSSNETILGTSTVTNQYGTAANISAKDFSGYLKPADQYVEWNSTSAKTITFIYTPKSIGTATLKNNEWWWKKNNTTGIQYTVTVAFSNRTSDSVVATITWTNTILANTYFGYYTAYSMVIGGASSGTKRVTENSTWSSQTSYARSRSHTTTMTIKGLSAMQTSVSYTATPSAYPGATCPSAFSGTLTIPTY